MYVLDHNQQIKLIKEMTHLRNNDEKWEAYYHHPSTNEMWKTYFPRARGRKRGPKILRTEPVPEQLDERLAVCLSSENPDDAKGLAFELSVYPQKWEQVIDIIEKHYHDYHRSQLHTFFKNLGVLDYKALFDELGYTLKELNLSEKKLKDLKWRVRKVQLKKMFWF